jgi:hypothetical protein
MESFNATISAEVHVGWYWSNSESDKYSWMCCETRCRASKDGFKSANAAKLHWLRNHAVEHMTQMECAE